MELVSWEKGENMDGFIAWGSSGEVFICGYSSSASWIILMVATDHVYLAMAF